MLLNTVGMDASITSFSVAGHERTGSFFTRFMSSLTKSSSPVV